MILGILSDTHGHAAVARRAIARLIAEGATCFLHAGDVGDGVLETLPQGRSAFVLGNNDWNVGELTREAELLGLTFLGTGGTLTLDGVGIAVTHGDDPKVVRSLLTTPHVRYLVTGHTHLVRDQTDGGIRWINPGALHRATRKTVATLDLATDELTFHTIEA